MTLRVCAYRPPKGLINALEAAAGAVEGSKREGNVPPQLIPAAPTTDWLLLQGDKLGDTVESEAAGLGLVSGAEATPTGSYTGGYSPGGKSAPGAGPEASAGRYGSGSGSSLSAEDLPLVAATAPPATTLPAASARRPRRSSTRRLPPRPPAQRMVAARPRRSGAALPAHTPPATRRRPPPKP